MTHVWNLDGLGQTAYDAWRDWRPAHREARPEGEPTSLPPRWEELSEAERAHWMHVGWTVMDASLRAVMA